MPAFDNAPLFSFIITHSTLDSDTDAEVLNQTHLEELPKARCFGKGRGVAGKGTAFRLYDGDGNLYYQGRQWDDGCEESAFAPLNWAANDSGCTELRCKNASGAWVTL